MKSEQEHFFWKSALLPLALAVGINTLIGGTIAIRHFSTQWQKNREYAAKNAHVLGAAATPTPEPTPRPTLTPTPTPIPVPTTTIVPKPPINTYVNTAYSFKFIYPSAWKLEESTEPDCHKKDMEPLICQRISLTSPKNHTFILRFAGADTVDRLRSDIPEENLNVNRTGYVRLEGKLTYWNILENNGKRTFVCYGKRYKLCDKKIFTMGNIAFTMYGGNLNTSVAPHISDAELQEFHKIVESLANT